MKDHKLLKREDIVTCDEAAWEGRIVADACSREQPTSGRGQGNRVSRGMGQSQKKTPAGGGQRAFTLAFLLGVVTNRPTGARPS